MPASPRSREWREALPLGSAGTRVIARADSRNRSSASNRRLPAAGNSPEKRLAGKLVETIRGTVNWIVVRECLAAHPCRSGAEILQRNAVLFGAL
jgi:hypothetical protein